MQSRNQNQRICTIKQKKNNPASQKYGDQAINVESPASLKSNTQQSINKDINQQYQEEEQRQYYENNSSYDDEYSLDSENDQNEYKQDLKFNYLLNIKQCVSNETIWQYQNKSKKDNLRENKMIILFLIVLYFICTLILISIRDVIDNISIIFILRSIFSASLLVIFIILPLSFNQLFYKHIIFFLFLFGIITSCVQGSFSNFQDLVIIQIIEILCIYTTFSSIVVFTFTDVIIYSIVQSCLFISFLWQYLNLNNCFFFFAYQAFVLQKTYSYFCDSFKSFNFFFQNRSKKYRMLEHIYQFLPEVTQNKMRILNNFNDRKKYTDVIEDSTVLFAQLYGFNLNLDRVVDTKKVLIIFKNLFEMFDSLCIKNGVFKLYTINTSYVVMSIFTEKEGQGRQIGKIEQAKNIINMGLDMIESIKAIQSVYNFLNVGIGVHTGKTIGGIIGSDYLKYDVFGRNVEIAKQIEYKGEPGKVMISQSTKDILDKEESREYQITQGESVQIQDKIQTVIQGYYIKKKDEQN